MEKQPVEAPEKKEEKTEVKVEGRSDESEEPKVEEPKVEEHKPEEHKAEEHKAEEHKVEEHKVEEQPKEPLAAKPEAQPEQEKPGMYIDFRISEKKVQSNIFFFPVLLPEFIYSSLPN